MPSTSDTNPLLQVEFRIPFDRIRAEHVEPAASRVAARSAVPGSPRWPPRSPSPPTTTRCSALDKLTEPLDWAMGVVRHLESVATYPELRAAYNAVQPRGQRLLYRHPAGRRALEAA